MKYLASIEEHIMQCKEGMVLSGIDCSDMEIQGNIKMANTFAVMSEKFATELKNLQEIRQSILN